MRDQMYAKASRRHRRKAFFFAVLVHVAVIGGLIMGTQSDIQWKEYVPEPVKEWLNIETPEEMAEPNKDRA
ncbi:MAG: hypothetical protein AAF990_10335 [Bacteroidota bacterium]